MPTLSRTAVAYLTVPPAAKNAWLREAGALEYPDPGRPEAWRAFVREASALAHAHLPFTSFETLYEFFSPGGPDALLIENLPVDPMLPPTPTGGARPAAKSAVSEAVIAGIVEPHAAIVSYLNEKAGAPIHEIAPVPGLEHVPSSSGRVSFAYHTDVAFLAPNFSPRGLLLFGLRNESGAPTSVLMLEKLLEAAPDRLIRTLEQPVFRHPTPASFHLDVSVIRPVLWTDWRGMARIAVQTHAVQGLTEEARDAIAELRALTAAIEPERVVLRPGSALLFKNDRVLHGRDAFTGERWLQRAYFTDSLGLFQDRAGAPPQAFAFDARDLL